MKIAYILVEYPVLYNIYNLHQILTLMDRGVDVGVWSLKRARNTRNLSHDEKNQLSVHARYFNDYLASPDEGIRKQLVKYSQRLSSCAPALHRWLGAHYLHRKDEQYDATQYYEKFGWTAYAFDTVAKILKQENVDAIHAGFAARPASAAKILSDHSGIPYTFEAHAQDLFVEVPKEKYGYEQGKIEKAAKIFTISEYNKAYILDSYKKPTDSVMVFRVPFNKDYCDKILDTKKQDNLIVTVCRLTAIKGLTYAIAAFAKLAHKYPNTKFKIIGEGPLRQTLSNQAAALGIDKQVEFTGNMGNEAALDFVASATVFLLPCVIDEEGNRDGIPTALIESMYLRTPVISSHLVGIPELIDDGENGLLAQPGNVEEIAEKLDSLLSNRELRKKLAERGRDKVVNRFYEKDSADVLIEGWQQILNTK